MVLTCCEESWKFACVFDYQDEVPLASLPLLGYAINSPSETDEVHRDLVFKLQFRNHVYFFRAESRYAFERYICSLCLHRCFVECHCLCSQDDGFSKSGEDDFFVF